MDIQKNYYAIIPANVRYDEDLKPNAKLLYGEITALSNEKGYCWASNSYFADLYKVSKFTISRWIAQLEEKKHITTRVQYKKGTKEIAERHIYIGAPYCQKEQYPIDEKSKDNNTLNTTLNTTVNKDNVEQSSHIEQSSTLVEKSPVKFHFEIVSYLNEICGTSYRVSSKKTQQLINARLKEGFTVEDFKVVIYKMNLEWRNDKKMHAYLRPETLFGPKFEGYLNRKEKEMTLNDVDIEIDYDNLWG